MGAPTFMGALHFSIPSAGKTPHAHKIPRFRGGGGWFLVFAHQWGPERHKKKKCTILQFLSQARGFSGNTKVYVYVPLPFLNQHSVDAPEASLRLPSHGRPTTSNADVATAPAKHRALGISNAAKAAATAA